jgi:hypothetical protein
MNSKGDSNMNSIVALSGAMAAIAALIVAFVTCLQLKHSRFALGVNIILQLEATFDGPEMNAARKQAAAALKADPNTADIEPVLDFFETIGVLVRRKAIDEELVWSSFSYWVLRYGALARDQIHARRKAEADDTYYEEFDFLVKEMTTLEIKKRRLKEPPFFSTVSLASFLEEEIID